MTIERRGKRMVLSYDHGDTVSSDVLQKVEDDCRCGRVVVVGICCPEGLCSSFNDDWIRTIESLTATPVEFFLYPDAAKPEPPSLPGDSFQRPSAAIRAAMLQPDIAAHLATRSGVRCQCSLCGRNILNSELSVRNSFNAPLCVDCVDLDACGAKPGLPQ